MSEQTGHWLQQYLQEVLAEDYVTLRDFFAGCALIGYSSDIDGYTHNSLAQSAYEAADAMMAARRITPMTNWTKELAAVPEIAREEVEPPSRELVPVRYFLGKTAQQWCEEHERIKEELRLSRHDLGDRKRFMTERDSLRDKLRARDNSINAAEIEIKRLRAELRAGWVHELSCPCSPRLNTNVAPQGECTCGLREALYAPEGGGV